MSLCTVLTCWHLSALNNFILTLMQDDCCRANTAICLSTHLIVCWNTNSFTTCEIICISVQYTTGPALSYIHGFFINVMHKVDIHFLKQGCTVLEPVSWQVIDRLCFLKTEVLNICWLLSSMSFLREKFMFLLTQIRIFLCPLWTTSTHSPQ